MKELADDRRLVDLVAESPQLLHHPVDAHGEFVDRLAILEHQGVEIPAQRVRLGPATLLTPRLAVLRSSQAALALGLFAMICWRSGGTDMQMASSAIRLSSSST